MFAGIPRSLRQRASRGSRNAGALTSCAIVLRGAGDVSTQWLTSRSEPADPAAVRLAARLGAASSAAVRKLYGVSCITSLCRCIHGSSPGSFSISTSTRSSRSISSRSVGHGGPRGPAVDLADQPALADHRRGALGVGVVLDREDQHLLRVRDEPAVHGRQRRDGAGRADLAERVAQEHLARAAAGVADPLAQPLGGLDEALADLADRPSRGSWTRARGRWRRRAASRSRSACRSSARGRPRATARPSPRPGRRTASPARRRRPSSCACPRTRPRSAGGRTARRGRCSARPAPVRDRRRRRTPHPPARARAPRRRPRPARPAGRGRAAQSVCAASRSSSLAPATTSSSPAATSTMPGSKISATPAAVAAAQRSHGLLHDAGPPERGGRDRAGHGQRAEPHRERVQPDLEQRARRRVGRDQPRRDPRRQRSQPADHRDADAETGARRRAGSRTPRARARAPARPARRAGRARRRRRRAPRPSPRRSSRPRPAPAVRRGSAARARGGGA